MRRATARRKFAALIDSALKREAGELDQARTPKSNPALMRKIERALLRAKHEQA